MLYCIESDVKEHVRRMPDLIEPYESHLLMVAVRSRKAKEMMGFKCHDLVVERKVIRQIIDGNWKERYFNSIYNLAVLQCTGRYDTPHGIVPMEAMGIFATLSPRNVIRATEEFLKDDIELIVKNNKESIIELAKVNSRFFGNLHKHRATGKRFVTVDIDEGGKQAFEIVKDYTSVLPIWMITETSRGWHFILDVSKPSDAEAFFHNAKGIKKQIKEDKRLPYKIDIQNDSQEPIAGTLYFKERGKLNYVKIIQ
jgi:hypothetical protein